jgi:hypothetical protein
MISNRMRYWPAATQAGIVKFHQPFPAIIESTPHNPVVVSRPPSATLNQFNSLQAAVAASPTYILPVSRKVQLGAVPKFGGWKLHTLPWTP